MITVVVTIQVTAVVTVVAAIVVTVLVTIFSDLNAPSRLGHGPGLTLLILMAYKSKQRPCTEKPC